MTLTRPLLLLLPLLAACAAPGEGGLPIQLPGLFAPDEPEAPPAPPPLPAAVQAALPPGVSPAIVLQDNDGCYLYSIERTDPPSGYPIRDADGVPICESTLVATPVALPGEAPIDIAPVLSAPAPGAMVASADPGADLGAGFPPVINAAGGGIGGVGVGGGGLGGLTPGTIVPPAPLAPLN